MTKGEGQFWVASVEKAAQQIFKAVYKKKKVVLCFKALEINRHTPEINTQMDL